MRAKRNGETAQRNLQLMTKTILMMSVTMDGDIQNPNSMPLGDFHLLLVGEIGDAVYRETPVCRGAALCWSAGIRLIVRARGPIPGSETS